MHPYTSCFNWEDWFSSTPWVPLSLTSWDLHLLPCKMGQMPGAWQMPALYFKSRSCSGMLMKIEYRLCGHCSVRSMAWCRAGSTFLPHLKVPGCQKTELTLKSHWLGQAWTNLMIKPNLLFQFSLFSNQSSN